MSERNKLLLQSPDLIESTAPRLTSLTSSSAYILHITSTLSHYAATASSPCNIIGLFDKITLQGVQTLPGHEAAITSLKMVDNLGGGGVLRRSLVSSGRDGSVKVWDERAGSHSIKMTNLGQSRGLLCCDVSPDGLTVAAGTELLGDDALILYWDPRQPATPLRTHSSTHSDDITTLSYSPSPWDPSLSNPSHSSYTGHNPNNVLLSGSTDGLLCLSSTDEDDEDEAVLQVGNFGCSVAQAGWIHDDGKSSDPLRARIWAASDMETFSTWANELNQLMSLDIRSPVLHNGRTWVTDYLIAAQSSKTSTAGLSVFTGSNEGDVALLSNMNISTNYAPWCLHKLWTHGHVGVVRSLFWDEPNNILLTGGEDSKLNAWPIQPIIPETKDEVESDSESEEGSDEDGMDVDGSSPRSKSKLKPKKRELQRPAERQGKRARKGE